jgi:NNMT/PNMT/TEMT family protein
MIGPGQQQVGPANRDYPWDEFNSVEYFKFNYVNLRDDDREIVEIVRDFLARKLAKTELRAGARGIDVGTGANLYPALTMLPFCEHITLYEHSEANVQWLHEQSATGWPSWDEAWSQFWDLLSERAPYGEVDDPRIRLANQVEIVKGDVLDHSVHGRFDIGTMFFVAESISTQPAEFLEAMNHFFRMLKPNAPFAMAFMEHSQGYHVGEQQFPATDIGEQEVWNCLRHHASDFSLHRLSAEHKPLREHYTGMIVAHGRIKETS